MGNIIGPDGTESGGVIMSQKNPNHNIRCRVKSCEFHCGNSDYCSLNSIQVEPCECCNSGKPSDESMCGSYHSK